MNSSNPVLSDKVFKGLALGGSDAMTVEGCINKTLILLSMVLATALWTWNQAFPTGHELGQMPTIPMWYIPCIIATVIMIIAIMFKRTLVTYLAVPYALLQGVLMGAISAMMESRYPGIVFQAIIGTTGTFLIFLTLYRTGVIKVTEKLKMGIVAATGAIFFVYLIGFVMSFFGSSIPMIHDNGMVGIGFSVVVVGIAAFNLLLDFDFIEKASAKKSPKWMEWYGAFGLLVTLIWLYVEILRLLSKLRSSK